MTAAGDILLLADPELAGRLETPISAEGLAVREEPFAALEELARREYRVVVLNTAQPELPNLLAAIRQLQPAARLFGLCTPANESRLLQEGAPHLEDYFIVPPTQGEWQRMTGAVQAGPAAAGMAASQTHLPIAQVAELVHSAGEPDELANCISRLVSAVCRTPVTWQRQAQGRSGVQQILVMDDDPPRVLWAADVMDLDERQSMWLSSLRGLLPALSAAARRTSLLRRLATTDDLTGVYNRRYFIQFARQLLERATRQRFRVTLLVYDMDDFKHYNDNFGHAAGDEILRETASMMRKIIRKHDVLARIGGDEFAVLFWDAGPTRQPNSQPPQSALALADRFRQAVTSHEFKLLGPKAVGSLTVSGGLASFPWDGHTIENLLARADEALLKAKADGKNAVYLVGGEEPPSAT